MKQFFTVGDKKGHTFVVKDTDIAIFEEGLVHSVCSTFALAREVEWSSRLFVLEMKEKDEEGIGTMLAIDHKSPAMIGDEVVVMASIASIIRNEVVCDIEVRVGSRLVAVGRTGQKILKKDKIKQMFESVK